MIETCAIFNRLRLYPSCANVHARTVIIVVMLGFAMSFHTLFRDVDTFGGTCLTLFKAMLGEVEFFEEFPGDDFDAVATALLVVYLIVIAVMLLNLLIAVLSTSHSKVEGKADQEFKVSKARMIVHYRLVVDKCLLPPPFNLVQLVVSTPFIFGDRSRNGAASRSAKDFVGRTVFWLVLGPVAVVSGTVLWVMSANSAPVVWHRHFLDQTQAGQSKLSRSSIILRYLVVFAWCVVGAPFYLAVFWLTAPMKWFKLRPWRWLWDRRQAPFIASWKPKSVNDLLEGNGGGLVAGDLQMYLEDPISDPEVRQDERSRSTTVEHIKQLRDRLEKTNKANLDANMTQVEQLRRSTLQLDTILIGVGEEVEGVKAHLERRLIQVEQELARSQQEVDEKLNKILSLVERALDCKNS